MKTASVAIALLCVVCLAVQLGGGDWKYGSTLGSFPLVVSAQPPGVCADDIDDDQDGVINDGCPTVGEPENPGADTDGDAITDCDNALDDDGDGWVNDGCPSIGSAEIYEQKCDDDFDNDGDGDVDCDDSDCEGDPACLEAEVCDDDFDNDGDGDVDCDDSDCEGDPACLEPEVCDDDFDNDGDGDVDCDDSDCEGDPACPEAEVCDDDFDNDGDGDVDCDDLDCEGDPACEPRPTATLAATPTEEPTTPPPERERPDLDIFFRGQPYVNEDVQLVVIQAGVRNLGAGRSTGTVVRARSLDADWQGEERVPGLDRGESEEVTIQLDIREDVADQTHRFLVTVDPEDDIEEEDEDNNSDLREVWVPPPDGEGDDDEWTLILVIALTVTIGAAVGLAGVTLTVRHTIKVRRRKDWQEQAEEDEPPETCKPCTRYCRKIQIELKLARRAITHLTLVAHGPVSGEGTREGQVRGEVVEGLNEALRAHRRREEREQVQRLVEPVAKTLSQQLVEWLGPEAAPRDVSVAAHLKGGAVTFKFILYHCSTDNVWEKEDEWEEKFEDERDETVTTVRGLDPTKRVAPELTQQLMQFIEKL